MGKNGRIYRNFMLKSPIYNRLEKADKIISFFVSEQKLIRWLENFTNE